MSKIPNPGVGTTGSIAQDRYTHTPMVVGNYPELDAKHEIGGYSPTQTWGQLAFHQGLPLSGIDPSQAGTIRIQQGTPRATLHHEIIHAVTLGDLDPQGDTYKQVNRLLPDEVKANTHALYSYQNIPHDVVHESVPMFLTEPQYSDPKYNAEKLKVINAFPPATKNKLIRIMGATGHQPQVGEQAPDFNLKGF
jgi:hypothetical protein